MSCHYHLQKLPSPSYNFPVPPIFVSTLFMYILVNISINDTASMSKEDQFITFFFWATGRPPAPASRPVEFSVSMPGPAGVLLMKTSPAQMDACWWPGLDQAVRIAGEVPPASHLLLTLAHKLTTKQKDLACADQISQLVFGHLSLVPTAYCMYVYGFSVPVSQTGGGRMAIGWDNSACNLAWAFVIRQELYWSVVHAAECRGASGQVGGSVHKQRACLLWRQACALA